MVYFLIGVGLGLFAGHFDEDYGDVANWVKVYFSVVIFMSSSLIWPYFLYRAIKDGR